MEDVSDHYQTGLSRKIWVLDDTLADQCAPRRQVLRDGVYPPHTYKLRRRGGMIHAADDAETMTQLTELGAGRLCARRAGAHRARSPMPAHVGSAAQLPAACRSRAHQICGLEGRRHTSGTGPGSRFRSITTGSESRDSHGPILVHIGGSIHRVWRPRRPRSAPIGPGFGFPLGNSTDDENDDDVID